MMCVLALAAGALIALAAAGGSERPLSSTRARQLAGPGEVALVPPHNAGVGGWCLTRLRGGEGGERSDLGDCPASESKRSIERGPFQGPIVAESGNGLAVLTSGPWVETVVALVTAPVAAVSFKGYKQIETHASTLLPDHLRGVILELRGSASKPLPLPRFPRGHLVAWNRSGKSMPQTFGVGPPLAFGAPVRSWSNGAPARRGVCNISVSGVAKLALQSGGVVSQIEPHTDVRGRELLNCAHSYYMLNGQWPLEAYVLLDAAHPGTTPASFPGMRPLARRRGVFIGPGLQREELARRILGAWLVVAEGEDTSQRLRLLEHLHVALHLR
jgi:hypothetical protein